jgi:hypothetical protein
MKLGQKSVKHLVGFLGNGVSRKNTFHSEINWPLAIFTSVKSDKLSKGLLKFRFTDKATKIEDNLPHFFKTLISSANEKWKIVSNFCGLLRISEL